MNYLLWLHECRSYVYCGKLIEDDRNDLTLSYANSGLFFFLSERPWSESYFVHNVQSSPVTVNKQELINKHH